MENGVLKSWMILTALPGLGPSLIHRLVEHFGSPARVLAADEKGVAAIKGIGPALLRRFADRRVIAQATEKAEREFDYCMRHNISLLCPESEHYPALLKEIYDPPPLLYVRGDVECLNSPCVALVGSRAATSYGKRTAFEIGEALASTGVTVVSGLALGIDGESHRGSLHGGGKTIGVLGCGIDVVYPRGNTDLFRKISQGGGSVISEYGPGIKPEGFRFPARNRIISGMSMGVVVIEAALRSGSLITARFALEQGREVFAVPGRVDSLKSAGTHHLIREGAVLVHRARDIIEELGMAPLVESAQQRPIVEREVECNELEKQLLSCLETYPRSIDEIIGDSGLTPAEVHDILLRLELRGLARHLPGQQYEKVE